jgi:GMP synthase-like glutamine amidotransferase
VVVGAKSGRSGSRLLGVGEPLPPLEALGWLVVVGGPMNVDEHDAYPWLVREQEFLAAAIKGGKQVIGVCLGAQLAAEVLGGQVTANRHKEIGWFPVSLAGKGRRAAAFEGFPASFLAFHWHGDTFSIPPGACKLAESEARANQAFSWGDRILGLQFHLDYSAESIEKMLHHCGHELTGGPFVQSVEAIRASSHLAETARRLLDRLLDNLRQHRLLWTGRGRGYYKGGSSEASPTKFYENDGR